MAETGAGIPEPAADPWAEREGLWQQLLDGSLTEVYQVAGQDFLSGRYGLEPIDPAAYQYNSAGERASIAEVERIARELSAQRCWAVSSHGIFWTEDRGLTTWESQGRLTAPGQRDGVLAWDRHFIERAQIALIVLRTPRAKSSVRAVRALLRVIGRNEAADEDRGFVASVEPDHTRAEFYRRLDEYSRYFSTKWPPRPPYGYVVAKYLLDRYPRKTLIVSSPYEIAQLRLLRIPRDQRPDS